MARTAQAGLSGWSRTLAKGAVQGVSRCAGLSPAAGRVCVTGATGFVALHLVRRLLENGYSVVGTVRTTDPARLAPLRELQARYERLEIVGGVDCLAPESFHGAVAGCAGVFHTASPFTFVSADPAHELVRPAVEGTLGCLEACKRAGVRRLVITSSCASILNLGRYPWDYAYTSSDWNTTSLPEKGGGFPEPSAANGYRYSKTCAERAAWQFQAAEDCPFDVVSLNPPMVIGRNLNAAKAREDLNTSSAAVLDILTGRRAPGPHSMGWVDVEDVADAHIRTFERPVGGQRFLCAAGVLSWTEVACYLKEMYPSFPVVTDPPEACAGLRISLDSSELESLGVAFRPLKETLRAQCDSLIARGFAG